MQARWLSFFKGFLKVRLRGDYLERFFNMCRMHDIYLWNICSEEGGCSCCLYIPDFFRLSPLLKKTGTRIRITDKCGLPFYMPLARKRIIFILGLCLCMCMLGVMTNYVWAIEYVGEKQISENELTDFLTSHNIHYGMKKSEINCDEYEKKLRAAFPNITWTSIYFEGTKLYVEIKENEKKEPQLNQISGMDIICSDNGTIYSIITRNGIPLVKQGDTVEVGQTLVEGSVPVYDEAANIVEYQIYDADADIMVSTTMNYSDRISKKYPVIFYTGNDSRSRYIDIFGYHMEGLDLGTIFNPSEEKMQEKIILKNQVKILDNIYLPVYYGEINRKEYYIQYLEYTKKQMEDKLNENFEKFILSLQEKGVQIIEKNVKIVQNKEYMEIKGDIFVIKPTGEKIPAAKKEISIEDVGTDESEE